MARTTFPASAKDAYKGAVSEVRTQLKRWGARINRSPGLAAEIGKQLSAFEQANGITPVVPGTQKIIVSGVKVTGPAATGTYVNGYTFTIVDGNITAVVAS